MVMRTLKILSLEIPVEKARIKDAKKAIEEEFGSILDITIENELIMISGEKISNYKIHDRILEMMEEY